MGARQEAGCPTSPTEARQAHDRSPTILTRVCTPLTSLPHVLIGGLQSSMICRNKRHSLFEKHSGGSLAMREPWAGLVPIIASFASACFNPSYDRPACGPGGACPSGLTCSTQNICERPDQRSDGGLDSTTTATPPDARSCFGNAPFAICLAAAPAAPT